MKVPTSAATAWCNVRRQRMGVPVRRGPMASRGPAGQRPARQRLRFEAAPAARFPRQRSHPQTKPWAVINHGQVPPQSLLPFESPSNAGRRLAGPAGGGGAGGWKPGHISHRPFDAQPAHFQRPGVQIWLSPLAYLPEAEQEGGSPARGTPSRRLTFGEETPRCRGPGTRHCTL